MNIGNRIKELRKARGMSQSDLTKVTKIKHEYLSKYENNHLNNPTQSTVLKLARAFWPDKRLTDKVVMGNFYGGGSATADLVTELGVAHRKIAARDQQCAALLEVIAGNVKRGEAGIAVYALQGFSDREGVE